MPIALQTGVNWYQFSFLMGNGFNIGGDNSPEGKQRSTRLLRRILEESAKAGYGDNRAPPALLEQRSDLTPEILRVYLRQGSMSMPPFRPTELTDAEIVDIAAYLAESSKQANR